MSETNGFDGEIAEGPLATRRITLHALRARPRAGAEGRVLLLGTSSWDLRLSRGFLRTDLARRAEIATYEPRGIGRSARPDGAWRMRDYAEDALAALDALGWEVADVVGVSFGGMTALHLALAAPERIGRLALAATTSGGAGGASYDIRARLGVSPDAAARNALAILDEENAALEAREPKLYAERLAARRAFDDAFSDPSVTSGGYARLLEARAAHDVWGRLGAIETETIVIAGDRDRQAPTESQRRLAEALPNGVFRLYAGGHGVAFARPEPMRALTSSWYGPA